MSHRIGTKGQVVIPKHIREELGLRPGGEVNFAVEDGAVTILPVRGLSRWRGHFRGSNMAAELLADRRAEERREAELEADRRA